MSLTLRPSDPAGSTFHSHGLPTPAGRWSYILDDYSIAYGSGLWPFQPTKAKQASEPACLRASSVRVSPDVEHRSWDNEYVSLLPRYGLDAAFIEARMNLFVRMEGAFAVVVRTTLLLNLRTATAELECDCPRQLTRQAIAKASRLLDFIARHQQARDQGVRIPESVSTRWAHTANDARSSSIAPSSSPAPRHVRH
ncbi:hypothetical protein [Nocardia sp. NPDC047038]|uniref:hypothetical protein n=1 Tax=Nocardia sp. NPDC047038 TaxID=3154338 RepID=UPI0033F4CE33